MKIGFDARYVRTDHHDGISRFSARLAEHLAKLIVDSEDSLVLLISDEKQLEFLPKGPFELIRKPTSMLEPFVALQVNKLDLDIVFSPMQTMGSWRRNYALILTVHDLIYYRHPKPPGQFNLFIRLLWRLYHTAWWPQRLLLNRSDAVVAVSNTTKDLIQAKSLTSKPIYVVHNAADARMPDDTAAEAGNREKSLVYMGSFMPYKNVETLVIAMQLVPDFQLHLLSRISEGDRNRLSNLDSYSQVIFHNGTSDEDYFQLLGQCTALVSASRDEGFGIPLVESMSVGTPVIVSDIEIFHEIGGDAALYVESDDTLGFAEAITQLQIPSRWLDASRKSLRQAEKFNWNTSARELLNVLKKVSNSVKIN